MNSKRIFFDSAFADSMWQRNVLIEIDQDGLITSIEPDSQNGHTEHVAGVAIPAITNVHSHAFQRAFAGLSEFRTAENDSFWTWRNLMYDFVGKLSPEDVYIIARQLYLEMLSAGYSWVGEFHYLHNDLSGARYGNLAEMSQAVLQAAAEAGIGICLIPVLYQRGGFDGEPLTRGQQRFALTEDEFFELLENIERLTGDNPNQTFGMALHSLRAVDPLIGSRVVEEFRKRFGNRPVHIHVAEQMKEVENCLAVCGKRPVEYLFDQYAVDENWCLIHSTHVEPHELEIIAKSAAVVGLCPTTEANLGDGVFPAKQFLDAKGRISIGSDSHCSVDFRDELRTLEYGQRLVSRQRSILGSQSESVGAHLLRHCVDGGAQSIGQTSGQIAVGNHADLIVIDPDHPAIAGAENDRLMDRLIFCNHGNAIFKLMKCGRWIDFESEDYILKSRKSATAFLQLNRGWQR